MPNLFSTLYLGKVLNFSKQYSWRSDFGCFRGLDLICLLLIILLTIKILQSSNPESIYIAPIIASIASLKIDLLFIKLSPFCVFKKTERLIFCA